MHVGSTTMRAVSRFVLVTACLVARTALATDPKVECIASADQAQQARDDGKYRAARDAFVSCSRSVCPKMVAASCTKWLRETQDAIPTVVLSAKDANGADVSDARVTYDGAPLVSTLDGKPVEVDPGSHKLHFEHDGFDPLAQTIVVKAGEKLRSINVTFHAADAVKTETHREPVAEEKKTGGGSTARVVTTVAFGVLGAGALVGGITFGVSSPKDASTASALRDAMAQNACVGAAGTSSNCQALSNAVDAQNRDALLSVVMYVTAGVFTAVAIVAWLAWPKTNPN